MRAWLVQYRQAKGITQKELAKRSFISQPALCNIESGKINPRPETAKRIAKVLGVKWTRFFED